MLYINDTYDAIFIWSSYGIHPFLPGLSRWIRKETDRRHREAATNKKKSKEKSKKDSSEEPKKILTSVPDVPDGSQAHNLVYSHLRYDDSNEIRKHQSADDEKAGIDALNNRFKGMKLAFDIVFDEVDIMKTVDSFLFSE